MGAFVLISTFWSEKRIAKRVQVDDSVLKACRDYQGKPLVVLVPHFSLMESITYLPYLMKEIQQLDIGVLYRPFGSQWMESLIKKSRERCGLQLLSRKEGMMKSWRILKRGGIVAMLFDQHAGMAGRSALFFGQLVSCTELPDELARTFHAPACIVYPERTGFLRCKLRCDRLQIRDGFETPVIFAANAWLEERLQDEKFCADWLWLHDRWKTQRLPRERFFIRPKRNGVDAAVRFSGKSVLERKERVWIRLPNWLGDIVMAIPLILALRKGRPDFEVTLLVKERYKDFLEQFGFAENIIGLPQVPGIQYFAKLWQWRLRYPETHIVFTNSFRGDLESWVIGAPQRMGIQRQRALRRFLLTDVWNVPNSLQENTIHQTRLWELWFQHFGLKEPIDLSPIIPLGQKNLRSEKRKIGLICGTENSPLKRWPIAHWISLIERILQKFPNGEIVLLGTKNDWSLTRPIIDHFRHENIPLSDLVGQTNLVAFTHALLSCSCVVSNDTGGMHLSNMLGTPTIAIFGLTNPLRTGPIFGTHTTIIQPPTCPPHGGGNVGDVAVETVFREVETLYL